MLFFAPLASLASPRFVWTLQYNTVLSVIFRLFFLFDLPIYLQTRELKLRQVEIERSFKEISASGAAKLPL